MAKPRVAVRLLGLGLWLAVPVLLAALFIAMNQPVRLVRVEADLSPSQQRELREAVDPLIGRGMLTVDLDVLVDELENLSWPRAVRVRRAWPDALELKVIKESFVARWGGRGAVNGEGEVFRTTEYAGSRDLPMLESTTVDAVRAMQVFQMLKRILSGSGLRIAALEENELGEWRLTLIGGLRVFLGRDDLAERLNRFLTVHTSALAARMDEIESVDARYMNGVAVRWRDAADGVSVPLARAH